jgi:hypothetical protein
MTATNTAGRSTNNVIPLMLVVDAPTQIRRAVLRSFPATFTDLAHAGYYLR